MGIARYKRRDEARDVVAALHPSYASVFSGAAYFVSSGYCKAANINVSGNTPKTLKLTQTSVDCVRQTISLRIASAKKNSAQRNVNLRQPSSVRWKTESNTMPSNGLRQASPPSSTAPNST